MVFLLKKGVVFDYNSFTRKDLGASISILAITTRITNY